MQTNSRRKQLRRDAAQAFVESLDQLEDIFRTGGSDNDEWPGARPNPMKPIEPQQKRWPTIPIRERLNTFEQTPENAGTIRQTSRSHQPES